MFEVIESYQSDEGELGVILPFFGSGDLPVSGGCLVSPASFSDHDYGGTAEGAIPDKCCFPANSPARQGETPPCAGTSRNFAQEQIDAPELIILATALSECARLCVCLFHPAGLPGLLAAPPSRRGLVEVADQGSEPGSAAEG